MIKKIKAFFWGAVHNGIAHPLLIIPTRWGIWFHEWTATKWSECDD